MRDILSLYKTELSLFIAEIGGQSFRTDQIYSWLHKRHVTHFDEMSNLPLDLRGKLNEKAIIAKCRAIEKLSSADGCTKFLFALADGSIIESVLMKYDGFGGTSACISSQVGCKMSCKFCATGQGGFSRNLTAGEMLSQVYEIQKTEIDRKLTGVVVMGGGEPLDNFEATVKFIDLLTCKDGFHIAGRQITVSTCGIVPKIYELAKLRLPVTLAISLHSPDDALRKMLMPAAGKYPVIELVNAGKYYANATKRRTTYEYALINGLNDSKKHAYDLFRLLKGQMCHINLIPINPIGKCKYKGPSTEKVKSFAETLKQLGLNATIRRRLGDDVNAACGQLKATSTNSGI